MVKETKACPAPRILACSGCGKSGSGISDRDTSMPLPVQETSATSFPHRIQQIEPRPISSTGSSHVRGFKQQARKFLFALQAV